MVQAASLGLTRIVLLSPQRRVDLAIPDYLPLVGLQATLLRHGGLDLADEGIAHHGWVLRKMDGTLLDPAKSLAAQSIVDGDTLLLSPQDQQWPEPEFDDLADAAAHEARSLGASWSARHTTATGTAAMGLLIGLALIGVLRSGPPWPTPGACLLGSAVLLLGGAILANRVSAGRSPSMVLVLSAYVYAVSGSTVLVTDSTTPGRAQLLVASSTVALTAVLGLLLLRNLQTVHVALLTAGLAGAAGALLAMASTPATGAAVVTAVGLLVSPWLPRLAAGQAGLPGPMVPRPSTETPVDEPLPNPAEIARLVRRSDRLLTGLLWGFAAAVIGGAAILATRDDLSARLLAGAAVVVIALRARAFAAVRHRLPLLLGAATGTAVLAWLLWHGVLAETRTRIVAPVLIGMLLGAAGAVGLARTVARKPAPPGVSRLGDIAETVLIIAGAVLAAAVAGVFGFARGIGG
ncbi:type VII secretion integral membrane protein EccD [Hamadaea flava]|uniref:Type VII secretion integral membrane protein EccD n=1 Tax=Hamadaea flava TaxID=1742688 RepID=A0ABV8LJV7_9ACTN|nr:type VII secretion integral membrane protein EccD [Hamadaea flava]MCP2323714.1 type VII secretion integral membrane protein EccD [Hamadaea flava]